MYSFGGPGRVSGLGLQELSVQTSYPEGSLKGTYKGSVGFIGFRVWGLRLRAKGSRVIRTQVPCDGAFLL